MSALWRSSAVKTVRASAAPCCRPVHQLQKHVRAEPQPGGQGNPASEVLALRKDLILGGMSESNADAVVRNFIRYDFAVATKSDIERLEAELDTKMKLIKADLDSKMLLLNADLDSKMLLIKADLELLKADLKTDSKLLRADLTSEVKLAELRQRLWLLGAVSLGCLAAAGSDSFFRQLITTLSKV